MAKRKLKGKKMDIKMLSGKKIHHNVFGEGRIISVKESYIVIDFLGVEKKFHFPEIFESGQIIMVSNKDIQNEIVNYCKDKKMIESKIQAEKIAVREEENIRKTEEGKKATRNRTYKKNPDKTVWIKFEGKQDRNAKANIHKVIQNGQIWYVLHYNKRPVNVKDGDSFFMAEGITDNMGRPRQVITGRGHLYGFNEDNYSPAEWTKVYSWIPGHPWYVVIKDFEMLDTQIYNSLMLENVILEVGTETFEASSGKNRSYEYLMHIHTRKQHMKLTEAAETYINQKFDTLVAQYGSQKFETIL
jgi:hypothetical protein